jgi:hypothetical protein
MLFRAPCSSACTSDRIIPLLEGSQTRAGGLNATTSEVHLECEEEETGTCADDKREHGDKSKPA